MKTLFCCVMVALHWVLPSARAQNDAPPELHSDVIHQVDQLAALCGGGSPVTGENLIPVYRGAVLHSGDVQPLLDWLSKQRADESDSRANVLAEMEVHVAARRGDLRRASDVLNDLLSVEQVAATRTDLRLWQARLHDALGDVEEARKKYQSLLADDLDANDQQVVRLRLALMGLLGVDSKKSKADAKELIALAEQSKDVAFRNRAANVLAVQNQHADAVKLFAIEGVGTVRFRSASRVAEWAIRSRDRDKAIESAWDAVRCSELKRDRRYALALLVESYRMTAPAKRNLEDLLEALAKENRHDQPISEEMRQVWVELLRELGRHDEAIALFKSSAGEESGFSIEMRRELLEMIVDSGDPSQLIDSYRDLIKSEPEQVVWRSGLTRVLLEQGDNEQAAELWRGYIDSLQRGSRLLVAAQALGAVGMDDLVSRVVDKMVARKADHGQGLLYLADLQRRRGRVEDAESTLHRLNDLADVDDAVRSELASAFERVGRQDKAIEVTEAIRASRETVAEDVEMRLAWLYSEVGDEEKALQQWLALWRKISSIPRRRYVEDRLMTVASRLGSLADIAIDLEEKLADGNADDREAGLLVRIYSRVNDSIAASEILEEYMTQTGRGEVERLQEKGRIYQICNDYWNYEQVIERLIEVDPDGETEYLRQLALSMLERGKAQEARKVLLALRDANDGKDSIAGEFEAGVLTLVGMKKEAADAYRRGIVSYPDRIESYLLLANLLKANGHVERAVGMFQHLAENADRDDMFTIAIDGLLNMEADREVMQWARRITLQRLAGREDKNYLYQLLADLSSEVNDKAGQIRAMENSLAVSGTRRLSVLRECMDLSSKIRGGAFYSTSSRGPTNAGNKAFFAFGRRLIGLRELMPPQVFLDLGQAFLADGDVASAERTFALARNSADDRAYDRAVAEIFEKSGKRSESLVRYERLLRTSPSDVALMARVAKLNEQEGRDDVAFRFYLRGLNLLLAQTPLTTQEENPDNTSAWSYGRNRDAYQTYADRMLRGLLVTVPDDAIDSLFNDQQTTVDESLQKLRERLNEGREAELLSDSPRLDKQTTALRRIYFAFDRIGALEKLERDLLHHFESDRGLLIKFARDRVAHGRYDSVRRLRAGAELDNESQRQLNTMLGESNDSALLTELLAPKQMWQRFLHATMAGDTQLARRILRRVDPALGASTSTRVVYTVVNGVVVPRQSVAGANVSSWMRMALVLQDEGLALQFARSRLQQKSRYGSIGIKSLLEGYRKILPADSFQTLVRYAANLYKDDASRLVEYLWIVSQLRDLVGDDVPSDEELLEKIETSNIRIGYQFPFSLAMETFPESIRAEAMAHVIDGIAKKSRPQELVRVAFQHDSPIDGEVAEVVLRAIESGIQAALQDNLLRYSVYYLPRRGTAIRCPENSQLAMDALELLRTDTVRKRDERTGSIAKNIQAVILHQSGKTQEAIELVLPDYPSKETITDYYLRNSRDWMIGELVPTAPDRFLDALDSKSKGEKPTLRGTEERLTISRKSDDDALILRELERAIQDHPKASKYRVLQQQWVQKTGGIGDAIALNERQLTLLEDDAAGKSREKSIHRRLASLWFSIGHRVNGFPHWLIADEQDRLAFEVERKRHEQTKEDSNSGKHAKPVVAAQKIETPTKGAVTPKKAIQSKAGMAAKAIAKTPAENTKKKNYPKSIAGVKAAMDAGDSDAAGDVLRSVWRSFPRVVESPYGFRSGRSKINGLIWPGDPVKKQPSGPAITKRSDTDPARRRRERGGLTIFDKPKPRPPAKKRETAWQVLAAESFAVSEMQRIERSRTPAEIASISEVTMGLLRADRLQHGDVTVFAALVAKIAAGDSSWKTLMQFFTMMEEDSSLLDAGNESVMDVLLRQFDLTQLAMTIRLANACGAIGQKDRAEALYTHCALLAPASGVTFPGLITAASKVFEGSELMALAENMFAVTNQDDAAIARMLDLRMELLDPRVAADRSEHLFERLDDDPMAYKFPLAAKGAKLFAKAGNYVRARQCLACVVMQHGTAAPTSTSYYAGRTSAVNRVSATILTSLFPELGDGYLDYSGWLAEAATLAEGMIAEEKMKPEIAVLLLPLIALRQCQANHSSDASETLAAITMELVVRAKKHELVVIDVMHRVNLSDGVNFGDGPNLSDRAYEIERLLYDRNSLSHLRFGDLLRDAWEVLGKKYAIGLMDELLAKSLDIDLVLAAIELTADDPFHGQRVAEIARRRQQAEADYASRSTDAAKRKKTREAWKLAARTVAREGAVKTIPVP